MPFHRFKIGQTVVAPSGGLDGIIPRGPYVVVRLLPLVAGEPHYRVRSTIDQHERALLEGQLLPILEAAPPAEAPTTTRPKRAKAAAKVMPSKTIRARAR